MMIDRQHNFIVQKAVSGRRIYSVEDERHRDGRLAHRVKDWLRMTADFSRLAILG